MPTVIAGQLTDPDGSPSAFGKIKVHAILSYGGVMKSSVTVVSTDESGNYSFELEAGTYGLETLLEDHYVPQGVIALDGLDPGPVNLQGLLTSAPPATPSEITYYEQLRTEAQVAAGQAQLDAANTALLEAEALSHREAAEAAQGASETVLVTVQEAEANVLAAADQTSEDADQVSADKTVVENLLLHPAIVPPPNIVDVVVEARGDHILIRPDTSNLEHRDEVEFYFRGTSPEGPMAYYGRGRAYTMQGLAPQTTFYFAVRAINAAGVSEYYEFSGTTTQADDTGLGPYIDNRTQDVIDEFSREFGETTELRLDDIGIDAKSAHNQSIRVSEEMFQVMGEVASMRSQYEDRLAEGETLTGILIERDPETGTITNKAFNYTNDLSTEVGTRIDGVDGRIDLYSAALNDQENRLASAELKIGTLDGEATIEEYVIAADSENLAKANRYTRASVVSWFDETGEPVDAPLDPENPPVGWTQSDGPVAEDVRTLSITTGDGSTASVGEIAQVFQDRDGQLHARGGMTTNVDGRITGFVAHDDGSQANMDIIGDNVRIGRMHQGGFQPRLELDTLSNELVFTGKLVLTDGTEIEASGDIGGTAAYGQFYIEANEGVFPSDATASSDFILTVGRGPQVSDYFTYYKVENTKVTKSDTKRFNGSAWAPPIALFSGDILVNGTVNTDALYATTGTVHDAIIGNEIRSDNYVAGVSGWIIKK